MLRRSILIFSLFFVGCASSIRAPLHSVVVQLPDVMNSVPHVRGYELTQLPALLRAQIVDDFRTTVGQVTLQDSASTSPRTPLVSVTIVPDSFAYPVNAPGNVSQRPEIVWFSLNYTIKTADGVERSGHIPAYGPELGNFEEFQRQQQVVVKTAVVKLRRAVAAALPSS